MSSNIENSKDWLIHIGERVSLSFKDSSLSQDSKDILTAKLLFHDTDSKNSKTIYLNFSEIENKVWIQIGENLRVYGEKKNDNSSEEELIFKLDRLMIEDLVNQKMLYAGINHPKYNIKTKEVDLFTIKNLSTNFI
ncbi:MAG: DUF3501 family protein [Gammaproteobacteria bacterium]|jgi:hypothetical protein|nr:MAG: DUF3501 family protein [Gammaproteobacteria bacterium]|tara:strand:- start:1860 stop:2267 length:408 start_codon:yes stop_codon:yes gene_type:complete